MCLFLGVCICVCVCTCARVCVCVSLSMSQHSLCLLRAVYTDWNHYYQLQLGTTHHNIPHNNYCYQLQLDPIHHNGLNTIARINATVNHFHQLQLAPTPVKLLSEIANNHPKTSVEGCTERRPGCSVVQAYVGYLAKVGEPYWKISIVLHVKVFPCNLMLRNFILSQLYCNSHLRY